MTESSPLRGITLWGASLAKELASGIIGKTWTVRRGAWYFEESLARSRADAATRRADRFAAMSPLRRWLHILSIGAKRPMPRPIAFLLIAAVVTWAVILVIAATIR